MNLKIVNQQAGVDAFHERLESILSSTPNRSLFRVLSAFVKMSGLNLLSQTLVDFLQRGGRTEWIIGVDLGGTSPEALRYLGWLERQYQRQVDVQILTAGTHRNVFHPKLYLVETARKLVAWVGSGNVTGGGMLSNFECLIELELDRAQESSTARLLEDVWTSYSHPQSPGVSLRKITPWVISQIEEKYGPEQATESIVSEHPLSPLNKNIFPATPLPPRLKVNGSPHNLQRLQPNFNELIMEILTETRETQVQIPVDALEEFFGVRKDERATIALRHTRTGQVKNRPIVHHRGMHRVEMEFIKDLARPLIVRLVRDPFKHDAYDYELFKRGSREFSRMRQLLRTQGRQTHMRARRWLPR